MRLPSSALSDCNRRAFSRSYEKLGIFAGRAAAAGTDGPTGVSKQRRIVHGECAARLNWAVDRALIDDVQVDDNLCIGNCLVG